MTPLFRRILREWRAVVVPLAAAAVLNIAAYVLIVYPLSLRVSATELRQRSAELQLAAAEREYAASRAMLTSKDRADVELREFYGEILPDDLAGARRIAMPGLRSWRRTPTCATSDAATNRTRTTRVPCRRSRSPWCSRASTRNVRRFIHDLEIAPEFIVIEDVALAEGAEPNAPLTLTLQLATYFRAEGHGG